MKSRRAVERNIFEDLFQADDPFSILVELQSPRDARIGAVRPHQKSRRQINRRARFPDLQQQTIADLRALDKLRRRHPFNARANCSLKESLIQKSHSANAELVVRTVQIDAAA